jgi:hypothetical protein
MSLLLMTDSKFNGKYLRYESDDTIDNTTIIILSDRVRLDDEFRKNTVSASFALPSASTILEIDHDRDTKVSSNSSFINHYYHELESEHMLFFSRLIYTVITNGKKMFVIVTSDKEDRGLNLLKIIGNWIYKKFKYHAHIYKKSYDNLLDINVKVNKIEKKCIKNISKFKKTYPKRYYEGITEKEFKYEAKQFGVWDKYRTRADMIEDILFLIDMGEGK